MPSDGVAANDGAVGSQRGPFLDQCALVLAIGWAIQSGHQHIGKDTTRSEEDVVFNLHTFIDRHIILDTDTIADVDIGANIDILSQRAVLSKHSTFLDMTEMPYLGAFAQSDALIDVRTLVYIYFLFQLLTLIYYLLTPIYHPKGCLVNGYLAMG